MDSDGSRAVALTVAAAPWRTAINDLPQMAEQTVRAALAQGTADGWVRRGEVSLLLTNNEEVKALNAAYRQRDQATNVLSFPNLSLVQGALLEPRPPGPALLGDVVMSLERLQVEAATQKKPLDHHFRHLLVHGTLHLLGYDHEDEAQARQMEELEIRILAAMKVPSPYDDSFDDCAHGPGGAMGAGATAR